MDNRDGDRDDRWRDRDHGSSYSQNRDYGRGNQGGQDDRGFMDRAGDEVRSWFGDDEAERRREMDERRWEREQGMTGRRDNQSGSRSSGDSHSHMSPGGGWGNQAGESWNRDRPGSHGSYGAYGAGGQRERSGSGGDRDKYGREGRSEDGSRGYGAPGGAGGGGGGGPEVFGEPGFGGTSGFGGGADHGRRFDRIDPGHVGAQGAHPMSAPTGGGYGGGGISAGGGYSSSARAYEAERQGGNQGGSMGAGTSPGDQDPHYSQWRNRQIESIDRDYDEYRREHQSKFEQDFGQWRTKRGEQRQHMNRATEHMEVIGSDGEKIGTVDAIHGDRIVLTKNDENAGGRHHSIPCSWIERVEDRVIVNKSREEAMREWRDEERNRALFEREDSGSPGPHMLNRSFSGTYEDK